MAAEAARLPSWLYRSEAFAEDLAPREPDPQARDGEAASRRQAWRSALLYALTLSLALLGAWPAIAVVA